MVDTFGEALRQLRKERGWSVAQLAARIGWSKQLVSFIENDARRPTPDFAIACDKALDTAPILTTLCGLDSEEYDVRRRALMHGLAAAIGVGAVASFRPLAEVFRRDLEEAVDVPQDWDATIAGFQRRLVLEPSAVFGDQLLASMLLARQQMSERREADATRASAHLGLLYGVWMGHLGNTQTGHNYYRTAQLLAERSGDRSTQVYVLARTASGGPYQGLSRAVTREKIMQALELADQRPSDALVEAHAARVHLAALEGDLVGGRAALAALAAMWHTAHQLPDSDGPGPVQRAASFRAYLEGRLGPLDAAELAWQDAQVQLAGLPQWRLEAQLYFALAQVRHGQRTEGLRTALEAAQALRYSNRVIRFGVDDVLAALPSGYRDSLADELSAHGTTGPKPWELT